MFYIVLQFMSMVTLLPSMVKFHIKLSLKLKMERFHRQLKLKVCHLNSCMEIQFTVFNIWSLYHSKKQDIISYCRIWYLFGDKLNELSGGTRGLVWLYRIRQDTDIDTHGKSVRFKRYPNINIQHWFIFFQIIFCFTIFF